jgi:hypothetical protein
MSAPVSYHHLLYPAFFCGKELRIVTRHQKNLYLQPALSAKTGLICKAFTEIDTDLLGTFSGEIDRTLPPLECAREKCRQAAAYFTDGYLLASEGSFGPHPALGFIAAGEEWLLFYDIAEKKELVVRDVTLDTCFRAEEITEEETCIAFLESVGFPEQKVILKSARQQPQKVYKDLASDLVVVEKMKVLLQTFGNCYIETDMRAMNNPARQRHLTQVGEILANRLSSICSHCGWYGFSVSRVERGLPCSWCGSATDSVLSEVLSCINCGFEQEQFFPAGKQQEDPQFCNQCNP